MCVCVCWGAHLGAFGGCCGCLFSNLFIEVKMVFLDFDAVLMHELHVKSGSFRRPPPKVHRWPERAFLCFFLGTILIVFRAQGVVVFGLYSGGIWLFFSTIHACKSETRDVPTNLGGTKNKAHTGTDK